jgi:hypothetical protein
MKPTFPIIQQHSRRDSVASRKGSHAPRTDCCFQADVPNFSGGNHRGDNVPPFRGISAAYFDSEARSHFKAEAIVFGLIVLSAAVPVIQGLRSVAHIVSGAL